MSVHSGFIALAFLTMLPSLVHADPTTGGIVFFNKTPYPYTLKLSTANDCMDQDQLSILPFTVNENTPRTYAIKLRQGCDEASLELDYTQRFDPDRLVTGKVKYNQTRQDRKWRATLSWQATPPFVAPKPILMRAACSPALLACASKSVSLANEDIIAHFTVIPLGTNITVPAQFRIGK